VQEVDAVIVSLHWGYERERYPLPYQRIMAHDIVDAGASLVLGHHSHVLQGIEEYAETPIAYSLGNFIFPEFKYKQFDLRQPPEHRECVMLDCTISNGKTVEWRALPVKANEQFQPEPQKGSASEEMLRSLADLSAPLSLPDYKNFWRKNRTRMDLPEIRGTGIFWRARLRLYRKVYELRMKKQQVGSCPIR